MENASRHFEIKWLMGPPREVDWISYLAEGMLFDNAKSFLKEGLRVLLGPPASAHSWKLSVVAIQTAVELLAKYRLVSQGGIESIADGAVTYAAFCEGDFRSISYWKVVKRLEEAELVSELDLATIREIQQLRNKLVHFAADPAEADVRRGCLALVQRALCLFADRRGQAGGGMEGHTRTIGSENFRALMRDEDYRDVAVEHVSHCHKVDAIRYCWECENYTLARLSSWESYYCYCCGSGLSERAVGFADCSVCSESYGVYYDPGNPGPDGAYFGKCCDCKTEQWVDG